MGYRKVPTVYHLTFADPEYDGLEVVMTSIKIGKIRKLMRVLDEEGRTQEQMDEMFNLIDEGLVSWNLEDENGQPVPTTVAGIEDQELQFILDILETWLDGMTGVNDDLGKGSSSGETFPVELPTMDTL
jgi:hypothetical protein